MPLYEYQCSQCGRFEIIQKFSDSPLSSCPRCGGEVQKLLSAPAIQFKGTGWYITDYARKPAGGEAAAKSGDGGASSKDGSNTPSTTASKDSSTAKDSSTSKNSSTTGSSSAK